LYQKHAKKRLSAGLLFQILIQKPHKSENQELNPQSKVKKSKVEKSNSDSGESPGDEKKHKKPPLREREPVNDMERIEKAYLQNWDILFCQHRVKKSDPIVNWNQTRKLIKNHLVRLKPDDIISAIKIGMSDDFIMQGGYSLAVMLSASVLNRLINASKKTTQAMDEKKPLSGLKPII